MELSFSTTWEQYLTQDVVDEMVSVREGGVRVGGGGGMWLIVCVCRVGVCVMFLYMLPREHWQHTTRTSLTLWTSSPSGEMGAPCSQSSRFGSCGLVNPTS